MNQKTLVIIHTGPVTVQPLNALAPSLLPGVRIVNLVDDSLLKDAMAAGHVTPAVTKRLAQFMVIAEEMGADLVLNACSRCRSPRSTPPWPNMPLPLQPASASRQRCRPRSIPRCG
jgi:hypothetical protein